MIAHTIGTAAPMAAGGTRSGATLTAAGRTRPAAGSSSMGPDETGAEVGGQLPAVRGGQLLPGHEELGRAADQEDQGQHAGGDPQSEAHGRSATAGDRRISHAEENPCDSMPNATLFLVTKLQ